MTNSVVRLGPIPDIDGTCPSCAGVLEPTDWCIPGLRVMALMKCPRCERRFAKDFPVGHNAHASLLLDLGTGEVYEPRSLTNADVLFESYLQRVFRERGFEVRKLRSAQRPLLLNCLDYLYGHSVLKLLNAQYYLDRCREFDLVVIVPRWLEWMVPEGVAELWVVDIPLRGGKEWNDWLVGRLHQEGTRFGELWLAAALAHPHPDDFDIERFTTVGPLPSDAWSAAPKQPVVTFVWRSDRVWTPGCLTTSTIFRSGRLLDLASRQLQKKAVSSLASRLRETFPLLDFAVAGLDDPISMPPWIKNLISYPTSGDDERAWCERFARSHVVVGIHGSSLILPSAHAGSVVELVPTDRWGNAVQDLLPKRSDVREALFVYRSLPVSVTPKDCAKVVTSLLLSYELMELYLSRAATRRSSGKIEAEVDDKS